MYDLSQFYRSEEIYMDGYDGTLLLYKALAKPTLLTNK